MNKELQHTTTTTAAATEPIVIGARYTYNSLVTSQDSSKPPFTLPSHLANHPHQHKYNSTSQTQTSKTKNHTRSTSHPKSFNAFLKDTNDEWSDDIHDPTGKNQSLPQPLDVTIDHEASKVAEAVLTTPMVTPTTIPVVKKKKKTANANGIKDHVQDILLGNF